MMQTQQFGHPFASQYNLPLNVANWKQGQAIPQGWRLGRKGYLKPAFTLPSSLSSWQQGQPLPQGYRLNKRGTLRPINYFSWWVTNNSTFLSSQQTNVLPASVEFREKPPVVQEVIKPGVREEIQPVIHRDREQLEIREEIQPIYEKSVRNTVVEQRQLAPEMRPDVRLGQMPVLAEGPRGSSVVEAEQRQLFMHQPIVEETVHKKIIEEVQPVIHREVIAPRVINERKDIYEKVVEAPTVSYTTLPPKFVGGTQQASSSTFYTTTTTTTCVHPYHHMLPGHVASWQQGQPVPQGWKLGRKGYLKPIISTPQQYSTWQQGQPLPQGWKLTKSGHLRPVNTWDYWNTSLNKQQQQLGSTGFAPSPIRQF